MSNMKLILVLSMIGVFTFSLILACMGGWIGIIGALGCGASVFILKDC